MESVVRHQNSEAGGSGELMPPPVVPKPISPAAAAPRGQAGQAAAQHALTFFGNQPELHVESE